MFHPRTAALGTGASLLLATLTAIPAATGAPERGGGLPRTLVVTAHHASAAISTAPFGLSFRDRTGRRVLGSVRHAGTPAPTLHVSDLLGTVDDTDVLPPRYAPITFTVGALTMTQAEPAPAVTGNPVFSLSSGATYSLTDVLSSRRLPDGGVRLTVATDDPTGRTALVEVRPDRGDAVRTRVRFEPSSGVALVGAGFASGPDEAFHGFGGRRNAVDQAGQSFFNWIDQTVFDHPVVGGQPQTGWYQQAQFISSRPYGFFLEQSELSQWRMRSDRDDAWQVESASPGLRFTVAPGRAPRAIRTLTAITGRTPVPPRWQVAPIFSQTLTGTQTGKSAETYEAEIRTSIRKIDRLRLPYKAFSFEGWWLLEQTGRLDDVIRLIRRHGMHPLVYFRAFAGNENYGYEDDAAFRTAQDQGYAATRADGSPYVFGNTFDPAKQAVQLDFTNPRTRAWWRARVRAALDAGADGFMQDFGEETMWEMRFADGSTGRTAHNRYPVDFHRTTRRIVEEWHRQHPRRTEPMFYVRSGYSGRPGSAAYESANWCGDYESSWSRTTGIGALTTDMLNRAVGGAYGFHCDTGGIMDLLSGSVTRELFLRWSWYAALTPGNRLHGGPVYGQKFPWSFDASAARIHRASLRLHRAAEPYILRLWRHAKRTGMPITRPLWLAHPGMPGARRIDQEYLLGPDVLVAPVVTEGARTRTVRFPRGAGATSRRAVGSPVPPRRRCPHPSTGTRTSSGAGPRRSGHPPEPRATHRTAATAHRGARSKNATDRRIAASKRGPKACSSSGYQASRAGAPVCRRARYDARAHLGGQVSSEPPCTSSTGSSTRSKNVRALTPRQNLRLPGCPGSPCRRSICASTGASCGSSPRNRATLSGSRELTEDQATAACTSPGRTTRVRSVTPPPIERPMRKTRSSSTGTVRVRRSACTAATTSSTYPSRVVRSLAGSASDPAWLR